MCTQNELQQILKVMIETYKKTFSNDIYRIYLYGSYARGDFSKESDIDIVAIVKGEREELQKKLKNIWDHSADMEIDYEVIISPAVIPYEEFQNYKDTLPYYKNILQEGVEIGA